MQQIICMHVRFRSPISVCALSDTGYNSFKKDFQKDLSRVTCLFCSGLSLTCFLCSRFPTTIYFPWLLISSSSPVLSSVNYVRIHSRPTHKRVGKKYPDNILLLVGF